jgi:hypothetical protein
MEEEDEGGKEEDEGEGERMRGGGGVEDEGRREWGESCQA